MLRFLVILLFSTLTGETLAQPKQAITNVTIIDVKNRKQIPSQTVIISNGQITKIGPASKIKVPKGTQEINGSGKFLIPGLWDMHVHLSYYGEEALAMLVNNGVLAVRDMGGDIKQLDQWRADINNGSKLGPTIFRAGPFVDGPKNMDAQRTSFTIVVQTEEQGRQAVKDLSNMKADFIKIHSRVPKGVFFAIAYEALKYNLRLMVHAPKDVSVAEISNAGARSIEHTESLLGASIYEKNEKLRDSLTDVAFKDLERDDVFKTIAKNKTYYDPTVVSLYLLNGTDYEKQLGPRLLPLVGKLFRAGVPLLTGSDFGVKEAGIVPGKDLHQELELFVDAGLQPFDALQAATINAAACLRVDDKFGSVEKGKTAQLVLLNANPIEDIRNTRKIFKVFVNGRVIDSIY